MLELIIIKNLPKERMQLKFKDSKWLGGNIEVQNSSFLRSPGP